jgi:small conductance mechanosensitive channel
MSESVMGRIYHYFTGHDSSTETRIFLIFVLAVSSHVLVMTVRHLSEWMIYKEHARKSPLGYVAQKPKFITVTRLAVSTVTFAIYFLAFGLILQEFKVDLTAYLASASVIGLAISFGLQGLIQDIVIGLTLIFWDTMDVGDMVEIYSGTYVIGRVTEIGLRFTKLVNFYNQVVLVPNRTIANVSRFPHGGVDAYADAEIPAESDPAKAVQVVGDVARGMWRQFGAIILSEPVIGTVEKAQGEGWSYSRVHFKIWPGQGNLIETTFRQQVVRAMKAFDPNYAEWRVPVTYRSNTDVKKMETWF